MSKLSRKYNSSLRLKLLIIFSPTRYYSTVINVSNKVESPLKVSIQTLRLKKPFESDALLQNNWIGFKLMSEEEESAR